MRIRNIDLMNIHNFETITVEELKRYMSTKLEKDYILVDVRQPGEYIQTHIPGALLIPLPDFMTRLSSLPDDRDIIFYCLAGSRSRNAAMLAAEQNVTQKKIYSLEGGISKWTGASLGNMPKTEIFDKSQSIGQLLKTAISLEKGAEQFYAKIQEINVLIDSGGIFSQLAEAEWSHAKALFDLLGKYAEDSLQSFEEFYEGLSSDAVEGGDALSELIGYIHGIQKYGCINLLDLAMDVEFASYDLYKSMANLKSKDADTSSILLTIAQAEKLHMKLIADFYESCTNA